MGFVAKSFCSLCTKGMVGFYTHWGGLTLMRAGPAGLQEVWSLFAA